jgi:hypothetical protein
LGDVVITRLTIRLEDWTILGLAGGFNLAAKHDIAQSRDRMSKSLNH